MNINDFILAGKLTGSGGGGGGGSSVEVEALSVAENGTYTAPAGKAYSPVTVNVESGGGFSEVEIALQNYDAQTYILVGAFIGTNEDPYYTYLTGVAEMYDHYVYDNFLVPAGNSFAAIMIEAPLTFYANKYDSVNETYVPFESGEIAVSGNAALTLPEPGEPGAEISITGNCSITFTPPAQ
jgi:hypothetical protein